MKGCLYIIGGLLGFIVVVLIIATIGSGGGGTVANNGKVRDDQDIPNANYGPAHVRALYVGHSYRVREGSTDQGWANSLLGSREAGNRDGITTAYGMDGYIHFENPPMCKVLPQPHRGPDSAVACVIKSGDHAGETIYATSMEDFF